MSLLHNGKKTLNIVEWLLNLIKLNHRAVVTSGNRFTKYGFIDKLAGCIRKYGRVFMKYQSIQKITIKNETITLLLVGA